LSWQAAPEQVGQTNIFGQYDPDMIQGVTLWWLRLCNIHRRAS